MGGTLTYPVEPISADRTFIVTGGNTGIGYETAKVIAQLGGRVIIGCRSEERAKEAITRMHQEHQDQIILSKSEERETDNSRGSYLPWLLIKDREALNIEFMKLDLSSLASTMEFINVYKSKGYPLHVLICNAGIGSPPQEYTTDGFEQQFQVNYLSHHLLILHLLPLLRQSAPNSRIVLVSSEFHRSAEFNLENLQGRQSYDRFKFYATSKVCQIMSMYALERRLSGSGIGVFSLHPGAVRTEIGRNFTDVTWLNLLFAVFDMLSLVRTPLQGAATSLVAALDPTYEGKSALYLDNCQPKEPSALARNVKKQDALWDYSLECLKYYVTDDLLKDLVKYSEPARKNSTLWKSNATPCTPT